MIDSAVLCIIHIDIAMAFCENPNNNSSEEKNDAKRWNCLTIEVTQQKFFSSFEQYFLGDFATFYHVLENNTYYTSKPNSMTFKLN